MTWSLYGNTTLTGTCGAVEACSALAYYCCLTVYDYLKIGGISDFIICFASSETHLRTSFYINPTFILFILVFISLLALASYFTVVLWVFIALTNYERISWYVCLGFFYICEKVIYFFPLVFIYKFLFNYKWINILKKRNFQHMASTNLNQQSSNNR